MAQNEDAVFYQGDQLNIDYTPAAATVAGKVVKVLDDGSDNVMSGVIPSALEADELGAADVRGIYKFKKEAGGGVTFTNGEEIDWDYAGATAVASGTVGAWPVAVCLVDAADDDDFVIGLLLQAVQPVNT